METNWTQCPFDLHPHILKVIEGLKFKSMTPVQAATIPVFLKKKDVAVEAVTGSGKTLAFVIPIIQWLLETKSSIHELKAIIISPTRELATQIYDVVQQFLCDEAGHIKHLLLIGGCGDIKKDVDKFEKYGANILVGTPGRIDEAFENCVLMRNAVRFLDVLILDEADRLLDLGFHRTLMSILEYIPKQRRTGLFSATQTEETEKLVRAGMRNPIKISVKQKLSHAGLQVDAQVKTPTSLKNFYCETTADNKFNDFMHFISNRKNEKILVFFSTCACVDYLGRAVQNLLQGRMKVMLLHGKMRKRRLGVFSKFRNMESGILICTDVMARGVDIPDLNWVVQYDPPSSASAFVHRCGRTARIGKKGNALVYLMRSEIAYVQFMEINQRAPMFLYSDDEDQNVPKKDYLSKLKQMSLEDRGMYEKAVRAFVSYIQSYAKHECNLIFRLKDIDFGQLAVGFAMLRMPKMPELKKKCVTFEQSEIDLDSIPYKDKYREKQRKEKIEKEKEQEAQNTQIKKKDFIPDTVSWSKKKMKNEKKKKRKILKRKHREEQHKKNTFDDDELDELERESRLVKKLKKGKITNEEFDREMKLDF